MNSYRSLSSRRVRVAAQSHFLEEMIQKSQHVQRRPLPVSSQELRAECASLQRTQFHMKRRVTAVAREIDVVDIVRLLPADVSRL